MAFKHGVYTNEVATSLVPVANTTNVVVAFGTAPIHLATDPAKVNEPTLISNYTEAVAQFGYSSDFASYTLCEAISAHFALYNAAPIVLVNVLDPTKHIQAVTATEFEGVTSTPITLKVPVLLDSVKVTSGSGEDEVTLTADTDYTADYDDDGNAVITFIDDDKIVDDKVKVSYNKLDPSAVTTTDIVGGVNINTGELTGLETIERVYPKFNVIPFTLIAPKYSVDSTVAAVMKAKASEINGSFKAIALVDLDTSQARNYTKVVELKNQLNFVDAHLVVCYPKVSLGGVQYHLSTHIAALMNQIDSNYDDIPYNSPSNKSLQIDSTVLSSGDEVYFSREQANYLNGNGVVTAINMQGWRAWGDWTSIYPSDTDPRNSFIPVRRMMNWLANTVIVTYASRVDSPLTRRLIDTILDSVGIWFNGLAARGAIVGGRIECLSSENPTIDLIDGILRFHVYVTPPVPAREIDFTFEFDPSYYTSILE